MIPNNFGFIRQKDQDLISALFYPIDNLDDYDIEVIKPDYEVGYVRESDGRVIANSWCACAKVDVSKYDFVLCPISSPAGVGRYCGETSALTGNITSKTYLHYYVNPSYFGEQYEETVIAYMMMPVFKDAETMYLAINVLQSNKDKLPVIGFIKKSD